MKKDTDVKKLSSIHFSSKSQTWNTPKDFFDKLDAEWKFDLDVACLPESALCSKYFTPDDDGLSQDWTGVAWCNPPFNNIKGWAKKAAEEHVKGATILMLVPSRTDTQAFQKFLFEFAPVLCFIKSRLKFDNPSLPSWKEDGSHKKTTAPFPTCLAVFDANLTDEKLAVLKALGTVVQKV